VLTDYWNRERDRLAQTRGGRRSIPSEPAWTSVPTPEAARLGRTVSRVLLNTDESSRRILDGIKRWRDDIKSLRKRQISVCVSSIVMASSRIHSDTGFGVGYDRPDAHPPTPPLQSDAQDTKKNSGNGPYMLSTSLRGQKRDCLFRPADLASWIVYGQARVTKLAVRLRPRVLYSLDVPLRLPDRMQKLLGSTERFRVGQCGME